MKPRLVMDNGRDAELYAAGGWRGSIASVPYAAGWRWKVWNVMSERRADSGEADTHAEALRIVTNLIDASTAIDPPTPEDTTHE